MRATQITNFAIRLNYGQVAANVPTKTVNDRGIVRSAAMLAAFGIALSSFSLKQMVNKPVARKF